MEDNKMTITRKDGIVYERKATRTLKQDKCDSFLTIRFYKETSDKLKEIANNNGIKYQTLIKELLNNFVNNNGSIDKHFLENLKMGNK